MVALDVASLRSTVFEPEAAQRAYATYAHSCTDPDLLSAWVACVPLIGRYYWRRTRRPKDLFVGDDLVAVMVHALYERLRYLKIPVFDESTAFANYLWRCCDRWFADAVQANARGAGIPPGYEPPIPQEGHEAVMEATVFLSELPQAAITHVLADSRFCRRFNDAARYVLEQLLNGERPRMMEVRRIYPSGDPQFVVDWSVVRLRVFLYPWRRSFRDLDVPNPIAHVFAADAPTAV